ncbi:MAG: FitA-like ribbon-helix-helix domain-containing protein [Vitreimonas sp.]
MGKLLIHNLDDAVIEKLRQRAAAKGNSMEEEARQTLARAVGVDVEAWLADVEAFAASLGESKGPPSEVLVREMREERTHFLHERGSGKK